MRQSTQARLDESIERLGGEAVPTPHGTATAAENGGREGSGSPAPAPPPILDVRIVLTNSDRICLVELPDLPLLAGLPWMAVRYKRTYYAKARVPGGGGRSVYMHRLIAGEPGRLVDHRNGNGLDNRRANLRSVTTRLNNANTRKRRGCSSRFKGVSFNKDVGRWWAYINVDHVRHSLGWFDDERDAARAYDQAAFAAWGEFARLNLINEVSA